MNKRIKYFIYTIILLILLGLYYSLSLDPYKSYKISNIEAEKAILHKYLDHNKINQNITNNDTSFIVFKLSSKNNIGSSVKPLMVLSGEDFYVFQDGHLIYSQDSNSYYQGKSKNINKYIQITYDPNLND